MKAVLDSNIAVKWVIPEADSKHALELRAAFKQGIHEFIAPDVFPIEVAHALVRSERKNLVTDGQVHLANILLSTPELFSSLPLLPRAYEIAAAMRCGVYDCLFVALAERERCELVTADQKMISNLQKDFPFIVALASTLP